MDQEKNFQNLDIANLEQRENIKKIESLKIGDAQKANLVLVILGVKPATELVLGSSEEVRPILEDSGLVVVEKEIKDKEIIRLAVAKDKDRAQSLALLDPSQDHEAFGRLMGFPESAIAGFVQDKSLDRSDYPDSEGLVFDFALSKEGWGSEVKLLQYWSQLLKKYSPTLYSKLLQK
jgi:hypothetical protein